MVLRKRKRKGISVFDVALNHVRDIELQEIDRVRGLVDVGYGAIVAARNGFFY